MTAEEELKELNLKMDTLVRLTVIHVLGGKKKTEAVGLLTEMGFTNSEIATLLRTTTGSVDNMRHQLKKSESQSQKAKKKVEP